MSTHEHSWAYKTFGDGKFWVVCTECATSDKVYEDEGPAMHRVKLLSGPKTPKTHSLLAPPRYGLNRRLRKSKRRVLG